MRCIFVLIFFCAWASVHAQKTIDEKEKKRLEHSNIRIIATSDDQRYTILHKTYKSNSDTVLVFESRSSASAQPTDTILKRNNVVFIDNGKILASGNNSADLIDFKNKNTKSYTDVRRVEVLKVAKQFIIQDGKENLTIYDLKGKLLEEIHDVKDFVSDGKNRGYFVIKDKENDQLVEWDGKKNKLLYISNNNIDKIEMLPSERFVFVIEKKEVQIGQNKVILILRTKDGKVFKNENIASEKTENIKITEINGGEAFLIDFQKVQRPAERKMLEIWYAGDQKLRDQKNGTIIHDYFLWKIMENSIVSVSAKQYDNFIGILDSRFVWAYHSNESFKYIGEREFDIDLYDTQTRKAKKIFERVSNLIASADHRFTLGFSVKKKRWILYDHLMKSSEELNIHAINRNPIFTVNGQIIFESDGNPLKYTIKSGSSELINFDGGEKVMFHNFKSVTVHQYDTFIASVRQLNIGDDLILKVSRDQPHDTGYFRLRNNTVDQIISFTSNRIRDFTYQPKTKSFFSVEENFNYPAALTERTVGSGKVRSLYQNNDADRSKLLLKQEIVYYTNSLGISLKGILCYPLHFDSSKKYPAVVHIYGIFSTSANKFISDDLGDNGFSKRVLLEKGYFVFQPDIVHDLRGTGRSALDCVHSALDAIADNKNIDFKKIGLIGHSLGGYETNFMATQSNRFAAYVSGASIADTTSFYFSFNDLFKIADYSRFETGQFAMGTAYAKDKELYFRNNPINYVENVNAPVLMWSGKKDTNVPSGQTMNFFMGLLRNNKKAVALLYENQKHSIEKNSEEIIDLNNKIIDWWDYFLKEKRNIPWIEREMKKDADD